LAEGAAHQFGDTLNHVDVTGPFGDTFVVIDRVEAWGDANATTLRTAREQEHGHRVCESLCDSSEGVLGAGATLHREDTDFAACVDPAEAVGHIHPSAFLAAYYGPDALFSHSVNQRLVWEACHPFDALKLQYLRDYSISVH